MNEPAGFFIRSEPMVRRLSFTKYEHELLPDFRQKINMAESTRDVRNFFSHTALELFDSVFGGEVRIDYDDIELAPERDDCFVISDRLRTSTHFASIWKDSDLPNVIARMARSATNRCKRLKKHPEKTDAKIRM